MPSSYQPAPGAEPVPPWSTAFLSQRDLTLRIPINYVTYPGVSVSAACFAHDVYEDGAAARCFSNLLATGFRRFLLDLYWDDSRRVWSLCPVQLPRSSVNPAASTSSTQIFFPSSSVPVSTVQLPPRSIEVPDTNEFDPTFNHIPPVGTLQGRQVIPTILSSSTAPAGSVVTGTLASGLNASAAAPSSQVNPAPPPSNGVNLIHSGPYSCTTSIDLPVLLAVLAEYLRSSSNTLEAIITYLTLNIHAAAPADSPLSSPEELNSSSLPSLISNLLSVNLSSYLYTPTLLGEERANLNSSWFGATVSVQPESVYFNTSRDPRGDAITTNGWPSESFVEFRHAYRLVAGFGSIEPQLSHYNFSGDSGMIFPQGAFQTITDVKYDTSGNVTSGCFFDPDDSTITGGNNSWAVSTQLQLPASAGAHNDVAFPTISNLTSCGISPLLNETLLNTTADQSIKPYQQIAYASIWSWADGEPRNVSSQEVNSAHIRCAAFMGTSSGRWRVADCTERHYAACRVGDSPYIWRITSTKATYSGSVEVCPDGSQFDIPRTGLENRYLLSAVSQRRGDDAKDTTIWMNFNSLDMEGCWVVGTNSSCPYRQDNNANHQRQVIVPTVAAVIVFVIAALTLFIKCAANRQNSRRGRRRRRADDGWDYEGVPS